MAIRLKSMLAFLLPVCLVSCTGSCTPKEAKVTVFALYQVAEHYELRVTGAGFVPGAQVTVSVINAPYVDGVMQKTTTATSSVDGEAGVTFVIDRFREGTECLVPPEEDLLKDPKPNATRGGTRPITAVMRQDTPYAVAAAGGYVPDCGWKPRP